MASGEPTPIQDVPHDLGHGRKHIVLNAFDMYTPTHMSFGQWKACQNPKDNGKTKQDLAYWTELAKLLERGGFFSLFIADTYGGTETYESSIDPCVRTAAQWPVLDPTIPVSAMAAVTKNLVFGITGSTTSGESPFLVARRWATLDHLTKGRVGWNMVTAYKRSAFKAIGMNEPIEHDERYLQADEYCRVLYKLWEGSWADDAVKMDAEHDVYTDETKVRDIKHRGKYFQMESKFIVNPSPQRTPFLFQAGTSSAGIGFASTHAEAIFLGGLTPAGTAPKVAKIRAAVAEKGRDPRSAKFFTMAVPIVGRTDEEAYAKYEEIKKYSSIVGGLVFISGIMGVDLSKLPLDQVLTESDSTVADKVHSQFASLTTEANTEWTPRKIAERAAVGGLAPLIIGSPTTVADEMERWITEGDIDGFTLVHATTPGSYEDVVDLLVPELRRRGVYPEAYKKDEEGLTARERVYGKGQSRLRDDHIGSTYKYDVYKEDSPYVKETVTEEK